MNSLGAAIALLLGASALAGCMRQSAASSSAAADDAAIELARADVAFVTRASLDQRLRVSGTLMAKTQSTLKARGAGEIELLLPLEGERVAPGQVVARINADQLRTLLAEREATLASTAADVSVAQRQRDAQKALMEQGFVSDAALRVAESAYLGKLAALHAAQAQLALARKTLQDAVIRSPIDGVVLRRDAAVGEFAQPGTPLLTVVDGRALQVVVGVPATEVAGIVPGTGAALQVAGTELRVEGSVARISPAATPGTRSFAVYVDVDNTAGRLRPGMFVHGALLASARPERETLPSSAVRQDAGQDYLLVITGGRIERRPVQVRSRDETGGRVEIAGAVDGRVPVLLVRHAKLVEGQRVVLASQ